MPSQHNKILVNMRTRGNENKHQPNQTPRQQRLEPRNEYIHHGYNPHPLVIAPLHRDRERCDSGVGAQIQDEGPVKREAPDVGQVVEVVLGLGFADYGNVERWEGWNYVVEGGLVGHFVDFETEERLSGHFPGVKETVISHVKLDVQLNLSYRSSNTPLRMNYDYNTTR